MSVPKKRRRAPNGSVPPKSSNNVVPNHIREYRGRRNLTRTELAEILNVTPSSISYWEMHQMAPTDVMKIKLCKALNCTVTDLFDWGDN